MSITIGCLVVLWLLSLVLVVIQSARICFLDFATVGAMTIAQVYHASRRGIIVVFTALVTLSWPLWLEINVWDRAVFREGKLVRVIDSGTVMFQKTWDKTTSEDVFLLMSGAADSGTKVDVQCPGDSTEVLIVTIDCKNGRDDVLKRLEFCSKVGVKKEPYGYVSSIVRHIIAGDPSKFDALCLAGRKLSLEDKGGEKDGTSRLKAKRALLEVSDEISKELWSRFGIRIIDVDFR